MNKALTIFLIVAFFAATPAFCQSTDFLELKAEMTQSAYLASKTHENLGSFIGAYEGLITAYCSREIFSVPNYSGDPKGEKCLAAIEKVLELDGGNPVALCARDGFKRRTCVETFAKQLYGSYDPINGFWNSENRAHSGKLGQFDTDSIVLEKKNAPRLLQLEEKLYPVDSWSSSAKHDPKLEAEVNAALAEAMNITCVNPKVILKSLKDNSSTPTPTEPGLIIRDMEKESGSRFPSEIVEARPTSKMSEILDRLNRVLPTPSPTPEPLPIRGPQFIHIRLVTHSCANFIKKALKVNPLDAAPVCFKEGTLSPNCVAARTRQKSKAPAPGTPAPKSGHGFESF